MKHELSFRHIGHKVVSRVHTERGRGRKVGQENKIVAVELRHLPN